VFGGHWRLLYFARRRSFSLRISAGDCRRSAQANVCRDLGQLSRVPRTTRHEQPDRKMRLLRIPQRVHGLPGASLRRQRRLFGGRTILRVPAAHSQPEGEEGRVNYSSLRAEEQGREFPPVLARNTTSRAVRKWDSLETFRPSWRMLCDPGHIQPQKTLVASEYHHALWTAHTGYDSFA